MEGGDVRGASIAVAVVLLAQAACGPPDRLDTESQVDGYVARGDLRSACAGLNSRTDHVRIHTATRLGEYPQDPAASACLAEAAYDAEAGTWDEAVVKALDGSRHDGVAKALATALGDARITDRDVLAKAMGRLIAPSGFDALAALAKDPAQPEALRASAAAGLQSATAHGDLAASLLSDDPSVAVRQGAAAALAGRSDAAARDALIHAATKDPEAVVRKAAVDAMGEEPPAEQAKALCDLMLSDPDPGVRAAAILAFRATKSQARAVCLAKVVKQGDDDGSVREAVLEALKGSPTPASADVLCAQIGPWLRRYGKDKNVYEIPGADIVTAQNFRDFERSYECVVGAQKQGKFSCYARNYLAHWVNDLGGKATPPHCPGMALVPRER